MLKHARLLLLYLAPIWSYAQVVEDFSDGDFLLNPIWEGDTSFFRVNEALELQSNGPAASEELHLVTANSRIDETEWRFTVRYENAPSNANRIRYYLVADSLNLEASLQGYYLELGESQSLDALNFFRQDGAERVLIGEGPDGALAGGINAQVRVTRDSLGNWTVFADTQGGENLVEQYSLLDDTYASTAYVGWYVSHTSTRASDFFLDDVFVGEIEDLEPPVVQDSLPPTVQSLVVTSANQLRIRFSEPMDLTSLTSLGNYTVNPGAQSPFSANPNLTDSTEVNLNFLQAFQANVSYSLGLSGLTDLAGNAIQDTSLNFSLGASDIAEEGEVIINEIYPDPTPSLGLPDVEYLELFNTSDKTFNLAGWSLSNGSTQGSLPSFELGPGAYVILSSSDEASVWDTLTRVISPSPWPSLVNGGDELGLRSGEGALIDTVAYDISWYGDPEKDGGGYALERINPNPIACPPRSNWAASNAEVGGTPAAENSIFSQDGDTLPPTLASTQVLAQDSLLLCFSESMDAASLEVESNFGLSPGIQVMAAVPVGPDFVCVKLALADTLQRGITYQVIASGLQDCAGNSTPGSLVGEAFLGFDPEVGNVVFNELMIDPNPSAGLPEVEFIELINVSNSTFNLDGWIVSNGTRNPALGSYALPPGEVVLLVEAGNEPLFPNLNNILGVSPFPNLPNNGGTLELKTSLASPNLDSVTYSPEWYQNGLKAQGGYSLEKIDAGPNPCPPISNWIAAEADTGGTPGFANSATFLSNETESPLLATVSIQADDTLLFCFTEGMDPVFLEDPGNYTVSNGIQALEALTVFPDQTCVRVALSAPLVPGTIYTVSVSEVRDCRGNVLEGVVERNLLVGRTPNPGDVVINEIMADPSPSVGLPEAEYLELFNRSNNAYFMQGWTLSNGSTVSTLPDIILEPGAYAIATSLEDTAELAPFGNLIPLAGWPSLVNSGDNLGLRTPTGILMDTVDYELAWYGEESKSQGGYALERINPDTAFCIPITNWAASLDEKGGTPGAVNSIFSLEEDRTAPVLEENRIVAADTLLLCFDETLDMVSAGNRSAYALDPGIEIAGVEVLGPDFSCVKLALSSPLDNALEYSLTITGIGDCKGNTLTSPIQANFALGIEPEPGEVILTEIMADPAPAIGLPEVEYVELYNGSENTFQLEGWVISNGSTIGTVPTVSFEPGAYLILVPLGEESLFADVPNVVPVSPWPSLVNSRDNLGLRSARGTLLDSVDYDISWYRDPDKDNGGYSLERIDLEGNLCTESTNWIVSAAEAGGTPAEENSRIPLAPDVSSPMLSELIVQASDTLKVCFSEAVTVASSANTANYQINGQELVKAVIPLAPDFSCVRLVLSEQLVRGIAYTLSVTGIADCYGNLLEGSHNQEFSLGEDADPFDVVITEIFPDPSPVVGLPEIEFVEIYNRSNKIIDLSGWSIQDPSVTAEWGEAVLNPAEYAILCRTQDALEYAAFGKVIPVDRFPSLGNSQDSIFLLNSLGIVMEYVFYESSWYGNELKDDGGFSLERIDPNYVDCNNPGNWSASRDESGGTPGSINSIQGIFQDSLPPIITGVTIVDPNTISLFFNEQMDPETLQDGGNYQIDPSIGSPLLGFPVAPAYNQVLLFLDTPLDSSVLYTLTYANLSDCGGNTISGTTVFGFPEEVVSGDVLLNEILFNPFPGGTDFVEIVNTSEKVLNLEDLFLGEVDPETGEFTNIKQVAQETALLLPGQIVCLTANVEVQKSIYSPPDTANFYQMASFPSYADAEGIAVVFTLQDTLDVFAYQDDFHFPTLADDDGVSLERLSLNDPTQEPGNWHSASSTVNYASPGFENSQRIQPEEPESEVGLERVTFTPNGDGDNDVLSISYDFDFIGVNTRIRIFDANGRLIRTLQNNVLLDPGPGNFFWDGRDDNNQKALIGPYVILFEVVNQQTGEKEVFKLVSVLADNF